jgi:hypothetical protein
MKQVIRKTGTDVDINKQLNQSNTMVKKKNIYFRMLHDDIWHAHCFNRKDNFATRALNVNSHEDPWRKRAAP